MCIVLYYYNNVNSFLSGNGSFERSCEHWRSICTSERSNQIGGCGLAHCQVSEIGSVLVLDVM